jgi:hypothetical protein
VGKGVLLHGVPTLLSPRSPRGHGARDNFVQAADRVLRAFATLRPSDRMNSTCNFERDPAGKAESLLQQQRSAEQLGIAVRPAYELNSDRQPVLRQSAGKRDCRTTDQGDDEGQEHPVYVRGELFTRDLGRKSLLDRKRRHRNRGAREQIVGIEKVRHAVE